MALEAAKDFENRLQTDVTFKSDFELYKSIQDSLIYRFNAQEKNLRDTLRKIQAKTSNTKEPKVFSLNNFRKIAVAASVVLLVALSVYRFNSKPSFNDFAQYDDLSLVVRGDDDTQKKMLEKYFNDKQFAKTLPLFEDLLRDNPNDNKLLLYKALALVETNNTDSAFLIFDKLIVGKNKLYKSNALWYKSLAYLKVKNYDACKETLSKISSDSDYSVEAKKLLSSL